MEKLSQNQVKAYEYFGMQENGNFQGVFIDGDFIQAKGFEKRIDAFFEWIRTKLHKEDIERLTPVDIQKLMVQYYLQVIKN